MLIKYFSYTFSISIFMRSTAPVDIGFLNIYFSLCVLYCCCFFKRISRIWFHAQFHSLTLCFSFLVRCCCFLCRFRIKFNIKSKAEIEIDFKWIYTRNRVSKPNWILPLKWDLKAFSIKLKWSLLSSSFDI